MGPKRGYIAGIVVCYLHNIEIFWFPSFRIHVVNYSLVMAKSYPSCIVPCASHTQ